MIWPVGIFFSWKVWFSEQSGFRTKRVEWAVDTLCFPRVALNIIWIFLIGFNSSYGSVRLTCNCSWSDIALFHRCAGLFLAPTGFVTFRTVSEQNLQVLAFSGAWPHKGTHRMRDFVYFPSGAHPEVPRKPWRPPAGLLHSCRALAFYRAPGFAYFQNKQGLALFWQLLQRSYLPQKLEKMYIDHNIESCCLFCLSCSKFTPIFKWFGASPPCLKEPVVRHSQASQPGHAFCRT